MNHRYSYCRKEDNLNRGVGKGATEEDEEMTEETEMDRCKQIGMGYKGDVIPASPLNWKTNPNGQDRVQKKLWEHVDVNQISV